MGRAEALLELELSLPTGIANLGGSILWNCLGSLLFETNRLLHSIALVFPSGSHGIWGEGAEDLNDHISVRAHTVVFSETSSPGGSPLTKRQDRTRAAVLHSGGFTMLEIATVMVILGILGTLIFPVVKGFSERAEALKCMEHLKGLGLGTQAYMVDHRCWPQISPEKKQTGDSDAAPLSNSAQVFAEKWIAALAPYAISEKTWRCPSVERQIKLQGKKEALDKKRIDYIPTSFDTNPESPTQWPKHPWFIERGSLHGAGQNLLFADGSISNMAELVKATR